MKTTYQKASILDKEQEKVFISFFLKKHKIDTSPLSLLTTPNLNEKDTKAINHFLSTSMLIACHPGFNASIRQMRANCIAFPRRYPWSTVKQKPKMLFALEHLLDAKEAGLLSRELNTFFSGHGVGNLLDRPTWELSITVKIITDVLPSPGVFEPFVMFSAQKRTQLAKLEKIENSTERELALKDFLFINYKLARLPFMYPSIFIKQNIRPEILKSSISTAEYDRAMKTLPPVSAKRSDVSLANLALGLWFYGLPHKSRLKQKYVGSALKHCKTLLPQIRDALLDINILPELQKMEAEAKKKLTSLAPLE